MKRPMCILAVSWLTGILLARCEAVMEMKVILVLYILILILGLSVLKHYPGLLNAYVQIEWYSKLTLLLVVIPCLFLGGYYRMEAQTEEIAKKESPWKLLEEQGEDYVTVEGKVCAKTVDEQIIVELSDCRIIGYYGEENQLAGNCRVRVENTGKEWLPEVLIGNKLRVFGKVSTFLPASNPGQFDAREYYTGKGLFANVSALRITILDDRVSQPGQFLFLLKQCLRESIASLYSEEKAGVLVAMILGDKDLLPDEVEAMYRKNGISHILAISGLHISMLCMSLFRCLRKLRVPFQLSLAVSAAFLVFYIFFTGASTSSLRAGIMCLVLFGARLFHRSYDLLSSLSFAAILVTAVRPGEICNAGFLLSFGAVLGVVLAKEAENTLLELTNGKRPWWCALLSGGMIQCITMPISLWFFYELSPYSILLNLLVIPLVSLILGGGILSALLGVAAFPSLARFSAGGTYVLLEFYEWVCRMTQKLPFSFVLMGRPEVWKLAAYYAALSIGLGVFFWRAEKEKKVPCAFLWSGVMAAIFILLLPGEKAGELIFLDVSQGDSAIICTEEGTVILSDCGSSDVSAVGEYRLLPALKQKGILLLDMAVVSHTDRDHISGIKELLENMPVYTGTRAFMAGYDGSVGIKELVLPRVEKKSEAYLTLEALALKKGVKVRYIQAGEVLYQEKKLMLECLSPEEAKESENDTSLVFLLQTPKLLVWLMGDAGTEAEEKIVERLNDVDMQTLQKNRLVLLKTGHHGSKTSSGAGFIEFVKSDVSVISCGYENSYGHPHAIVLERLRKAESKVFRTDLQGAVVVKAGRNGKIEVHGWLEEKEK